MNGWRVRLLALLTVVAMLLTVAGPAAMARTTFGNDGCGALGNCSGLNNGFVDNGACNTFGNCGGFNDGLVNNNGFCGTDQFGNPINCGLVNNNGFNSGFGCFDGFGSGNVAEEALAVALC